MTQTEEQHQALLTLNDLRHGTFMLRRNRFIGEVDLDGEKVRIHIPDPGRLTELLYSGSRVIVQRARNGSKRKTGWSLIAAREPAGWILVNTFLHRSISRSLLSRSEISPFGELLSFRAEVTPEGRSSRFDFLLVRTDGEQLWLETKGCTLKEGCTALFPDAPTARGARHLRELTEMADSGQECAVMFLVFPWGANEFSANSRTDPAFADALRRAVTSGVRVCAVSLAFDGTSLWFRGTIPYVEHRGRPE